MDTNKLIMHVCRTGKKEQFYTLYNEGTIVKTTGGITRRRYFCNYQQNLAFKKSDAMEKAEDFRMKWNNGFWDSIEIQYWDSPRMIYEKFEAFGVEFKTAKSGKVMWGRANSEFWDLWKADKQSVKAAGFWVKKLNYDWLVFCKTEPEYDFE